MSRYDYLIIGGGMTADAAVRGIRLIDQQGSIGLISSESHPPYNRPPLSKALWKGEPLDTIWRKTESEGVTLHLDRTAQGLDLKKNEVTDDRGGRYSYRRLLLATGGKVRRLPFAAEGIIYFRTLDDYDRLRKLTGRGKQFAVIGGGFIGSEIAAALAMNGKSVTMIVPEDGIGARVYPPALSHFLVSYYQSKGVTVLTKESVVDIATKGDTYVVRVSSGKEIAADGVVAGIGIQPNVELAESAGLRVGNGIIVDEHLRTSQAEIYAAGDVANFHNPALQERIRVEHEDNAKTMGEMAGKNMAGGSFQYHHLPFFYSDLFDLGYEGVGELDARLETVEDWKEKFKEGVVYYLRKDKVRGVLLWNTWGLVDAARALIAKAEPVDPQNVKGFLPAQ